jgi:hypothetical protein
MKARMPDRACIADDTPLRLELAARLAFPDGSMAAAGLRKEYSKGHLAIEWIAGKQYTTLADIQHMREACRAPPSPPASGFVKEKAALQRGSSSTAESRLQLAAARATMRELRESSPPTSRSGRTETADVTPLRSPSPRS